MSIFVTLFILASWWNPSPYKHLHYVHTYVVHDDACLLGLDDFIHDLGFRESSNRYHVVNPYGYLGRYQFSYSLVKRMGFNVSRDEFLSDPLIQDQVLLQLLFHNKQVMRDVITIYDGTYVHGMWVTESGILAAAHLIGPGRVKRFLKYGELSQDAFGTSVDDYLSSFSGYNLNI